MSSPRSSDPDDGAALYRAANAPRRELVALLDTDAELAARVALGRSADAAAAGERHGKANTPGQRAVGHRRSCRPSRRRSRAWAGTKRVAPDLDSQNLAFIFGKTTMSSSRMSSRHHPGLVLFQPVTTTSAAVPRLKPRSSVTIRVRSLVAPPPPPSLSQPAPARGDAAAPTTRGRSRARRKRISLKALKRPAQRCRRSSGGGEPETGDQVGDWRSLRRSAISATGELDAKGRSNPRKGKPHPGCARRSRARRRTTSSCSATSRSPTPASAARRASRRSATTATRSSSPATGTPPTRRTTGSTSSSSTRGRSRRRARTSAATRS